MVDAKGRPIAKARVRVVMVPSGEPKDGGPIKPLDTTVYTDDYGVYAVQIAGDARHRFTVEQEKIGRGEIMLRPGCGLEIPRLDVEQEWARGGAREVRARTAVTVWGGAVLAPPSSARGSATVAWVARSPLV